MADTSRSTAEGLAPPGFRVDPHRVKETTAPLRAPQRPFAARSAAPTHNPLPADRRVALHRLFPTRADVVSALLASFHWGVPVVTYEPKAYVGTNGILYGDVLEIEDA